VYAVVYLYRKAGMSLLSMCMMSGVADRFFRHPAPFYLPFSIFHLPSNIIPVNFAENPALPLCGGLKSHLVGARGEHIRT